MMHVVRPGNYDPRKIAHAGECSVCGCRIRIENAVQYFHKASQENKMRRASGGYLDRDKCEYEHTCPTKGCDNWIPLEKGLIWEDEDQIHGQPIPGKRSNSNWII